VSASRLSIVCDGGNGGQVIADLRDNPFQDALYPAGAGGIVRMLGGLRSEPWAPSLHNGGRHQIGIGGRLTSESAISDQILGIPAKTQAGQKAKALVALVLIEENQPLDRMDGDMSFAYEALRDVAGDFA
jgi:hypothetical protein